MQHKSIWGLMIVVMMISGLYGCSLQNRQESENTMTDECKAILSFLNCDYELISNVKKQGDVIDRLEVLREQGKTDGFFPLIIIPSDTLAETLEIFIEGNDLENTPESIAAYRQTIIEEVGEIDGAEFLSSRLAELLEDFGQEDYDIMGQFTPSHPNHSLSLYMLEGEPNTEVIIAKIPAKNPWELAAWMPMGGFNECPSPQEQVAVFRYWYEEYEAIPVAVTYDIWQLTLAKPPLTDDKAEALAKEQFAFCSDIVMQGAETIRGLASTLKNATMWFFWWD